MFDWLKRLFKKTHVLSQMHEYLYEADAHTHRVLSEMGIKGDDAQVVYMFTKAGTNDLLPKMRSIFRKAPQLARFRTYSGETLLHLAVQRRSYSGVDPEQLAFIQELLDGGIDVNVKDEHRSRPLMFAVTSNQVELVEFLLKRGADVRARTKNNVEPIHHAHHRKMVEILLEHGADINARTNKGNTVLSGYLKRHTEEDDFSAFLRSHGAIE
jgi:ankyrin repeat protein